MQITVKVAGQISNGDQAHSKQDIYVLRKDEELHSFTLLSNACILEALDSGISEISNFFFNFVNIRSEV